MPGGAGVIFLVVVSIAFMAVGVLGICKKVKRAKGMRGMHKVKGVLMNYTVAQKRDEDGFLLDVFFPVYEYEWEGESRELYSTVGVLGYQCHTMGKRVHILIDPQTEKVSCLEDEKSYEFILLIFGVIGILVLVVLVLLGTGVLS